VCVGHRVARRAGCGCSGRGAGGSGGQRGAHTPGRPPGGECRPSDGESGPLERLPELAVPAPGGRSTSRASTSCAARSRPTRATDGHRTRRVRHDQRRPGAGGGRGGTGGDPQPPGGARHDDGASRAPPAGNRRLQRFPATDDPATLRVLRAVSPGMLQRPTAAITICTNRALAADYGFPPTAPGLFVDVGTAMATILLAAQAIGVGAGPVTWFSRAAVAVVLRLPNDWVPARACRSTARVTRGAWTERASHLVMTPARTPSRKGPHPRCRTTRAYPRPRTPTRRGVGSSAALLPRSARRPRGR
jgi:nitroreductase